MLATGIASKKMQDVFLSIILSVYTAVAMAISK